MSPRPLFIAAYLMAGASALWVTWAVGTLFGLPQFVMLFRNRTEGEGDPRSIVSAYVTVSLVVIALALFFLLLAALDTRGSRAARVFTWIFAVPALAVAVLALVAGGSDKTPWWGLLTRATGGLSLVLLTTALVLLSLPRSRGHFRRAAPPPVPAFPPSFYRQPRGF
ncbi:hypothetical protein [Actinoplanes sp. HUAS TT8]|uniref:hypothetical protein n=1 Tax=Actinoplanes sp. HUAS TT8 TaxID=3447453 RepID=UPI003F51C003